MAFDVKAALKKPWVKYALIAIGLIGAYIIYERSSNSSSSSSTTAASGEDDAEYQADTALAQTQVQASAAAAAQTSGQNFQLAQQTEADSTAITEQQNSIAGQLAINNGNNATSISLGNIQLQGLQAQLNEALGIQTIQAQEQEHISDNQTSVSLNNTNQQASVAKKSSDNTAISSGLGAAAVAIAAFF